MGEKITLGKLRVRCRFTAVTLLDCNIHEKYGDHTRAEIVCTVRGEEARAVFSDTGKNSLEIYAIEDSGREEVLFTGLILRAELKEEGQYAQLSLQAVSNTWLMDVKRKSRSFQNTALTYQDIAKKVIGEYGADMQWNLPDCAIGSPLIQYRETDYRFLKRIFSHLKGEIVSVDTAQKPCFLAGLGRGKDAGSLNLKEHIYSLISYRDDKRKDQSRQERQTGYRIEGRDRMKVGDIVRIEGREYHVMETETVFIKNILHCNYRVFPGKCFDQERIPAYGLKGVSLTGKVIKTNQELVRLHLDIDREQEVSAAYDFPWKPITGNLFYCMPETGTRAALYFGKAEEYSGVVIMNIRENGEYCGETADYHDRYFTSQNNKRMYLKPSEMGFLNRTDQNAEIAFKDSASVQVKTNHKISVLAEGQVELKGRNVTVETPKEATLVRKDVIAPTVINLCNAFDAIGAAGNFTSTEPVAEKKRRMPGIVSQEERYSLDGAVEAILSNIPDNSGEDPVLAGIAGSMPAVILKTK